MSFSNDVKKELISNIEISDCCQRAELYAILLFANQFSVNKITFKTKNANVAKRLSFLLKNLLRLNIKYGSTKTTSGYYVFDFNEKISNYIFDYFNHSNNDIVLRINRANIENDCCINAFVRGAFLCCGSITDPELSYHCEFAISKNQLALDFCNILTDSGLPPKISSKNGVTIIYYKRSSQIEDLITFIGAPIATMEFINTKISKDFRNKINRRTNCETANIKRTTKAVGEQLKAISLIEQNGGLITLPNDLRVVAKARKENPYASLSELSEIVDEDLTRSGINYRMKKIIEISEDIKQKNKL